MRRAKREPTINSLAGLVQAFRRWARAAAVNRPPQVHGASELERQLLGALGGVAAVIAGEHLSDWPTPSREWAEAGPEPPGWLTETVALEMGREVNVLAVLYNACVSAANRRELGTVFTPDVVVEYMLGLVERNLGAPPRHIVNPGAGVGAFTLAAARRWPESSVVAIDLNPVTLGLLASRIAFEMDANPEENEALAGIELLFGDYLDHVGEGLPGPTLTIGNPPYTRVQSLPISSRRKAKALVNGTIDSGHANLAVLFQAATFSQMQESDLSCLILPASFTYTRASRELRRRLWRSTRAIEIHRWAATERAFIGHSVQAAILLVGAVEEEAKPVRIETVGVENGSVKVLERRTLVRETGEPADWSEARLKPPSARDSVPLSTIARTRRGIATGANSMFFLDDSLASELPENALVPGIPSLRGFGEKVLDERSHASWGGSGARRWLLVIARDRELSGRLAEYVESLREAVEHRYLPSKRDPWYSISPPAPPEILISPLAKAEFKVVVNRVAAIPSNNLFGIYPAVKDQAETLAAWLRSTAGQSELKRVSHRYPGGSYKLEPRQLSSIRLPRRLADSQAVRSRS